jgi:hypothetical protein
MSYLGKRPDYVDVRFEIKDIVDCGERGPTGQTIWLNQGNGEFAVFVDLVEAERIFGNLRQRTKITRADNRIRK